MRIITSEVWSVQGQAEKEIKLSKNGNGDAVVSDLFVTPLADCDITVTGYVCDEDENGTALAAIEMGSLSKADTITEKGVYDFAVNAYSKVKIEADGTADIVIKTIY